jgi:capsular exopolysaccharide synthesis family protein
MEMLHYLRVLRCRWMIVAASVLFALTSAALVTARTTPRYAASITLIVSAPEGSGNVTTAYQALLLSQQRVKSYAALIHSQSVATGVAKRLHDGVTAEELQQRITAQAIPDTVLLRATVTDPSAAHAAQVADMLGTEFSHYVDGLERPRSPAHPGVKITVADGAVLPAAPVSPRPVRNLGVGLLIGLIIGAIGAVLREVTDTSVRSVQVLRELTGAAVLGAIGLDRDAGRRPLVMGTGADPARAEAFRSLRTNLRFAAGAPPRSVAVTSTVAQEGSTTVACNLAIALAEAGARVVLVDTDLRRPRVADYLGIDAPAGLTNILADGMAVEDVLRPWGPGSLSVLPSGPVPPDPSELLASPRFLTTLRELEGVADIVIFDAPPLLSFSDAAIIARGCSGAMLVTRQGRTRQEEVAQAVERLTVVHAALLGTVLNFAQPVTRTPVPPRVPRQATAADRQRVTAVREGS